MIRDWAARSALLLLTATGPAAAGEGRIPADRLARDKGLVVSRVLGAAEQFSRHCQGCHGHHGVSVPEVPALKGRIGLFLHTPEGRAYLPRVPGVAFAHLADADLAAVLNWALRTYSAAELPPDFEPYSEAEVGALRRDPVSDITLARQAVVDGLVAGGVIADAEVLEFGSDRRY